MVYPLTSGLVDAHGNISPLFGRLYCLIYIVLTLVLYIFMFIPSITQDDFVPLLEQLCANTIKDSMEYDNFKPAVLVGTFIGNLLILISLMFLRIKIFIRKNTGSSGTSVVYGNFRRNIFTLNETFIIGITCFLKFYCNAILLTLHDKMNISHETARKIILWEGLIWYNLLQGFIFPLIILIRNCRKMPGFCSSRPILHKKTFNIIGLEIQPRRKLPESNEENRFGKRNKIFFIKMKDEIKEDSLSNNCDEPFSSFSLRQKPPSLSSFPTIDC